MKKYIILLLLLSSVSSVFAIFDHNLKYGERGEEVMLLQEYLNSEGILLVPPTGFFGILTLKAVREYQTSKGIPSTGYVGILTRTALNNDLVVFFGPSTRAEVEEIGAIAPILSVPTVPQQIIQQPVPQQAPQWTQTSFPEFGARLWGNNDQIAVYATYPSVGDVLSIYIGNATSTFVVTQDKITGRKPPMFMEQVLKDLVPGTVYEYTVRVERPSTHTYAITKGTLISR